MYALLPLRSDAIKLQVAHAHVFAWGNIRLTFAKA